MKNNIDDYRKGKVPSHIKKKVNSDFRSSINEILKTDNIYYADYRFNSNFNYFRYHIALINMIVQIIGIVLWACGKFLGMNGSDEKSQSENEA